jgi:hypothetical protein
MENRDKYQVYKGQDEIDNFKFYRLPKKLFDMEYIGLPAEAKLLYSIMLDRTSLSMKNCWIDEHNNVYVYFTLEDVERFIRVSKSKAGRLMEALDDKKGFGLIHREHQGLCKPDRIYVKNIVSVDNVDYYYDSVDGVVKYKTTEY